jgi:hypothetical protein
VRKFAGEGFNLNDEAGGKSGLYARLEAALKARQSGESESLAPLADDLAGVSSRAAMTSLDRPWSARRIILARITSQYDDVYFRAMDCRDCRSSEERFMSNELFRGHRGATPSDTRQSNYVIESGQKYVTVFTDRST